jgi:hypothetical protein
MSYIGRLQSVSFRTITFQIHYETNSTLDLTGFTDFDWDGDIINHKSTSGY